MSGTTETQLNGYKNRRSCVTYITVCLPNCHHICIMEIAGYIAAVFIGISLGLIGGGGSILTVPVLVYLFGVEPVLATAYSLFIVGSTSLIGTFPKYKSGEVNLKAAIILVFPQLLRCTPQEHLLCPQSRTKFSPSENLLSQRR